ncbi:MAG: hypothetical protein J6Y43_07890 [Clostridia bacterium]|nr:hypothetical protein [Clostridia bacterium]
MINEGKEKYEQLIRSSSLFSLNKERESIAYRREAMKMVEYLYCYLLAINESKYIEFGLEISETAKRCINNYNKDAGDFLYYFNAAWAKEYRRAFGKRQTDQFRCGMHVTEDDQLLVNKYLRFIENYSDGYDEEKAVPAIAEALGITAERVKEIIALNSIAFVSGDACADDEESGKVFDFIGQEIDYETQFKADDLFRIIDKEYQCLQQRQKKLISKLISFKISTFLQASEHLLEEVKGYSFFDAEVYDLFEKGLINARIIATQCGVSEQSASRSINTFIERIKLKQNT